jgi:hypothetical protein
MSNQVIQSGEAYRLTGSGAVPVNDSGDMVGVLCSTSTSGTLTLVDGRGRTLCSVMPLTSGQFYPMPFRYITGLTATIGGTADITLSVR